MQTNYQKIATNQKLQRSEYAIAHKIDTDLSNVAVHHHDFFEVNFLLSGNVSYTIENRIYSFSPGDLLIIGPNERHQVSIDAGGDPYERYMLWISFALLQRISTEQTDLAACFDSSLPNYSNLIHLQPAQRKHIQSLLELLHQESDEHQFGSDIVPDALLRALMAIINRLTTQGNQEQPATASDPNPMVFRVIDYIGLHYGEDISLQKLADKFYVSKYHLSHEFSHYVGMSVYQYLKKKRLMMACQMLSSGEKIGDAASACGFSTYTSFYRAFCEEYGMSPRQYISQPPAVQDPPRGLTNEISKDWP